MTGRHQPGSELPLDGLQQALASGEPSIDETLGEIQESTGADLVSIAAIERRRSFEILSSCGERMLAQRTRFPLRTSTTFSRAADGETFVGTDFERDCEFTRPIDQLLRARFRSGACLPLPTTTGPSGALSVFFHRPGSGVRRIARTLGQVTEQLSLALSRRWSPPIDVLICHDDELLGMGLLHVLSTTDTLQGRLARSLDEAMSEVTRGTPHVLVTDITLEGVRVDGWIDSLRTIGVAAPLVVVPSRDSIENYDAALTAGAAGYVERPVVTTALKEAIATVAAGDTVLPDRPPLGRGERITIREREVLDGLDRGLRLKEIAVAMGVSHATVKAHTRNLFRKLNVSSRAEATHEARHRGILV